MAAEATQQETTEGPASREEAASAYVDLAVVGYLLYGVGAVTAFLAAALSLTDAEAALHSSLLAVGLLGAGFGTDRLDARIGARGSNLVAWGLLALGSLGIATAVAYPATLAGAGMIGLAVGLLLAHANRALTRGAGALAQLRMNRSGLVAMLGSMSVPVVIWLGDATAIGWQLAFVVAGGLIVIGVLAMRWRRDTGATHRRSSRGRLSRGYWLTWWLVVLGVSVEFAIVFWASTLVERQIEVTLFDATLVSASFYVGMAATRMALSFATLGGRDPMILIRGGFVIAIAGTLLAWAATDTAIAAAGIFLAGVGVGCQYPMGIAVALSLVPGLESKGSARLILASGAAILVAPFVLGLAADASDVSVAWLLIPLVAATALGLSVPVGRARH